MGKDSSPVDAPRVTVVMPVFNGERWLADAVQSVLGQTVREIELVAVDDGSTDKSGAILKRFAATDERVRLAGDAKTNLGISAALNTGWRLARSPYIARLDADDIALPDRMARQIAFLDAHPTVAAVGGAVVIIDDSGRRGSIIRYPTSSRSIRSRLPHRNCFAHPAVTIRRSALERVGGYRIDHVEDYDLWLRLSEGDDLANLREPVILYRQHRDQVSLQALEEQSTRMLAVQAAASARRVGRPDPLDGVTRLTPDVLAALRLDPEEVDRARSRALLRRSAMLTELGPEAGSRAAASGYSTRTQKAAAELFKAERSRDGGRPLRGVIHVCLAVGHDRRYAWGRIRAWLSDRLHLGRA